jgi:hypothetical protein
VFADDAQTTKSERTDAHGHCAETGLAWRALGIMPSLKEVLFLVPLEYPTITVLTGRRGSRSPLD